MKPTYFGNLSIELLLVLPAFVIIAGFSTKIVYWQLKRWGTFYREQEYLACKKSTLSSSLCQQMRLKFDRLSSWSNKPDIQIKIPEQNLPYKVSN